MLTAIVSAVVILGLLVIVHEAGHFAMAKRLGVRVIRFSIGYPPKVWGIRRGETEYSIGATPFGGYVRMLGEEVGEEPRSDELDTYTKEIGLDLLEAARTNGTALAAGDSDRQLNAIAARLSDPVAARAMLGRELRPPERMLLEQIRDSGSPERARNLVTANPPPVLLESFRACSFPTQKLWKRFAIVLAGPAANIIFAPILLMIVFMVGVPEPTTTIGLVTKGSPAAAAGLRAGDRLLSVNGKSITDWLMFSTTVKSGHGEAIQLALARGAAGNATHSQIVVKPHLENEPNLYGKLQPVWIIGVQPQSEIQRFGPLSAAGHGIIGSVNMTAELLVGIWTIISGSTPVREALGGPIMIAQLAGKEAEQGFANVAMFTVMLSIELGLINLLPVPLLDGGHLLFFAFEGVRGKPLALRHREIALQVGLFLLVALMAFVIFNDISRIVQG